MVNSLFGDLDDLTYWKKEWKGMPEFIQEDLEPTFQIDVHFLLKDINGNPEVKFGAIQKIKVSFENIEAIQEFSTILGLKGLNCETTSCAFLDGIDKFGELIKQKINKKTRSIWFPEADIGIASDKLWISEVQNQS
jgi:hypothetical protein